jgi:hypothetical protein
MSDLMNMQQIKLGRQLQSQETDPCGGNCILSDTKMVDTEDDPEMIDQGSTRALIAQRKAQQMTSLLDQPCIAKRESL